MNKIKKLIFLCTAITLVLTYGCGIKSVPEAELKVKETASVSEETTETIETAEKINFFKSGKWISGNGIYYFFDDSRGFLEHRDAPDTSTEFSYELNADGSAVFHINGTDRKAAVNFKKPGVIDIEWETGDTETINFDTEEIPDSIKT